MIIFKEKRELLYRIGGIVLGLCLIFALSRIEPVVVESQQAGNTTPIVSLSGVTTGTGTSIATSNSVQIGWSIIWSAGVSAGEVVIESADSATYTGTWNELDRQAFSANSIVQGTYPGPLRFVRARVTTTVVDGTVTAQFNKLIGN